VKGFDDPVLRDPPRSDSDVQTRFLTAQIPSKPDIFHRTPHYLQFVIVLAAGWIDRDQQKIIDYLIEQIRVYQEHFKSIRLRFTDKRRRRFDSESDGMPAQIS